MRARLHLVASMVVIIVMWLYGLPTWIIPFFIGSVLIDFDHQIDFFLRHRRITLSVTELYKDLVERHNLLPLHSVEAILVSTVLSLILHSSLVGAFALGLAYHLFLDVWSNAMPATFHMSLICRVIRTKKFVH